jgi:hypothetical protein
MFNMAATAIKKITFFSLANGSRCLFPDVTDPYRVVLFLSSVLDPQVGEIALQILQSEKLRWIPWSSAVVIYLLVPEFFEIDIPESISVPLFQPKIIRLISSGVAG